MQVPLLRMANKFWIKKTLPDWHLLGPTEMSSLFENSLVVKERVFGLVKSVTALKKVDGLT